MAENKNNFEIIVQTKDLVHALGFASSVVEKRNVMQELSNIKLFATNGGLEIGATDMDLYLNQNIYESMFYLLQLKYIQLMNTNH